MLPLFMRDISYAMFALDKDDVDNVNRKLAAANNGTPVRAFLAFG